MPFVITARVLIQIVEGKLKANSTLAREFNEKDREAEKLSRL
jgi:hypothetical protein